MNDFLNSLDGALRGASRLPELELSWTRQPLPTELSLLSLCEVSPGVVWALGVDHDVLGSRGRRCEETVLLCREGRGWSALGRFKGRLLLALERGLDGAVYAAGEGACYRFDGGRWDDMKAPKLTYQRLWAPSADEVYALGPESLHFFDGVHWHQVDLMRAYGAHRHEWCFGCPTLSDIHGVADGEVWVVGTWFTHSTMLVGRRLDWRPDGCPSWYLYRVKVLSRTEALAVGGDGVVALRDGRWRWTAGASRPEDMPRAFFPNMITTVGPTPVVTGFSLLEEPPQVCLWVPDRWFRVGPRVALEQQTQTTASLLTATGELLLADFGATWSAPFPDPAQLVSVEAGDLDQGAGSIDDVIDGPWDGGTNEGDLWKDEDTVKDIVPGLTSLGETDGAGPQWPFDPSDDDT